MSQALARWRTALESVRTALAKQRTAVRVMFWEDSLKNYDGFAALRILDAAGIPPVHRPILGNALPSPYFVLRQDGKEIYRSQTVHSSSKPAWGDSVRIAVSPRNELKLQLYTGGLLSDGLLLDQVLGPLPPDGGFQVKEGSIVVDLEVQREK